MTIDEKSIFALAREWTLSAIENGRIPRYCEETPESCAKDVSKFFWTIVAELSDKQNN